VTRPAPPPLVPAPADGFPAPTVRDYLLSRRRALILELDALNDCLGIRRPPGREPPPAEPTTATGVTVPATVSKRVL